MKKMFSKTLPFRWRIQDFEEGRGINRLSLRDCPKFIRLLGQSKKCSSFKISFAQQTQNMKIFKASDPVATDQIIYLPSILTL